MSGKKFISAVLSIAMLMGAQSLSADSVRAVEYGIDISSYQGNINWDELKTNNISFVILRAGTSKYGIDYCKAFSFIDDIYLVFSDGLNYKFYL